MQTIIGWAFSIGLALIFLLGYAYVTAQEIIFVDEGSYYSREFATSTLDYSKQEEVSRLSAKIDEMIAEQKTTNRILNAMRFNR